MFYDPQHLADGAADLKALSQDSSAVDEYAKNNIDVFAASDAGLLFREFLKEHDQFETANHDLLKQVRTLLTNAAGHLDEVQEEYRETNNAAVTSVNHILKDLGENNAEPLGPTPGGGGTRGPLPSTLLKPPETSLDDPIWDILSWPDWLSAGSLIRKGINALVNLIAPGTGDIYQHLHSIFGGDWEEIDRVADSWRNMHHYLSGLGAETRVRMQIMFEGWYGADCVGAGEAGAYFSDVVQLFFKVTEPYFDLGRLYGDIAYASFGFFQAMWSFIDAAIDAFIAALLGVESILAAIASFGTLAAPAAVGVLIGLIELISSFWGQLMTIFYSLMTIVSLIDAALIEVQFHTLPQG